MRYIYIYINKANKKAIKHEVYNKANMKTIKTIMSISFKTQELYT